MYKFKQMPQQHYHTICARADSTKLCTNIKGGQISYIYNSHQIHQASKSSQRSCILNAEAITMISHCIILGIENNG